MPISSSPLRRLVPPLLATAISTLALAACGSDSGSSTAAPTDDEREAARLKLTQCLRENGVEVQDSPAAGGGGGRGGVLVRGGGDKAREAMEGPCKRYREAAFGNISAEDRQEFQDAFQKFAQCMRDNGVEVQDVTTSGGRGTVRVDRDDPDFEAAQEKCQGKLPRGGAFRAGGKGR